MRGYAISTDGGTTFTPPMPQPQLWDSSSGCQGSMLAVDGSLFFSNPYSKGPRTNMSLQRSDDNGRTWKRRAVNKRNHFDEYSALTTVSQPGMVGLLWETCDAGGEPANGCIKKDGSHHRTTFDPEATSINFVKMSIRFPGEE